MAIATISAWLKDSTRNYEAGVHLYSQYGKEPLVMALLKSGNGNSNYHRNRLILELGKLNKMLSEDILPKTPNIIPAAAPVKERSTARYSLTDPEWAKAPDAIKDLYVENGELKARADLAHHQRRIAQSDDERLQLALSELNDRDRVNENWKLIKAYHATGEITQKIKAEVGVVIEKMTMQELNAVLRNYPTYISKDKKELEALDPADSKKSAKREKLTKRIHEREVQLQLAKERLGNVQLV